MHIDTARLVSSSGRVSYRHLLRTSYREGGKVKHKTLMALSGWTEQQVAALRLALKYSGDVTRLVDLDQVRLTQGPSFGALWLVWSLARRLGLADALGQDRPGRLALWQVCSRVLEQGSRLSAVRLASRCAAGPLLELETFTDDDLYRNLDWLTREQVRIEDRLMATRPAGPPTLYLYDVTSTYLEGTDNELAAFGYNRDGKRGKRQLVVGLLTDEAGLPVSVEVFRGNTADPSTVASQIRKLRDRWQAEEVVLVGDRGMIRGPQQDQLGGENLRYITALTRTQIDHLIAGGILQMSLFDEKLAEVVLPSGTRFLLRRNPIRAEEQAAARSRRLAALQTRVDRRNAWLELHRRASPATSARRLDEWVAKLRLKDWVSLRVRGRRIEVVIDEAARAEASRLDGCYALKTDVPRERADAQTIHERYRDLKWVEHAFRTCKTGHLEFRPVWVRRERRTRAHALVVMLAYRIARHLQQAWRDLDVTVEEGLRELSGLCITQLKVRKELKGEWIPEPTGLGSRLLAAAGVDLPRRLPWKPEPQPNQPKPKPRRSVATKATEQEPLK